MISRDVDDFSSGKQCYCKICTGLPVIHLPSLSTFQLDDTRLMAASQWRIARDDGFDGRPIYEPGFKNQAGLLAIL